MKKSAHDSKQGEGRPVSKATMDEPQEEFIEDQAGVVADGQTKDGRREEAPPSDKMKPSGSSDS